MKVEYHDDDDDDDDYSYTHIYIGIHQNIYTCKQIYIYILQSDMKIYFIAN